MNPIVQSWEYEELKNAFKTLIRYLQGLKEMNQEEMEKGELRTWNKKITIYLK